MSQPSSGNHSCSIIWPLEQCWQCGSNIFDQFKGYNLRRVLLRNEQTFKKREFQRGTKQKGTWTSSLHYGFILHLQINTFSSIHLNFALRNKDTFQVVALIMPIYLAIFMINQGALIHLGRVTQWFKAFWQNCKVPGPQILLDARLGLCNQPRYKAPGDLWVKN